MTRRLNLAALLRQHREIGAAIQSFIAKLEAGGMQTELVTAMLDALRQHIYLEEVFLFPPLRDAGIMMPIVVMTREHGQLWETMENLSQLLDDPADGPPLEAMCDRLLGQLRAHSFNEEPAIYLHANYDLPASTSAELTRFVATGRLPEGWKCRQAKS
ncbi:hemerythrin domain-containing protein [Mycobacterium arosiense]|uniref:Hemerythrin n=1 Tax=Mycobacterium arosiense ATCC BAA-1401 = DSM 45069 TaxID=1265311 RepID=A0A1W9ZRT3_MYCAI|nr:hemerythrin domain-containing protein [Mycobacterium arosiense]ORA20383.1 hemerythrin [Mycobacterium arosiense ATCC BAA-1401 = DSM 45069]